jgi:hypothetical protein
MQRSSSERGKTKLLTVGNIQFYSKDRTEIAHLDPSLQSHAEYVTVTFKNQKNNTSWKPEPNNAPAIQSSVPSLSLAWSKVVARIVSSPKTSLATPVNFFYDPSARPGFEARLITQANTSLLLRTTATILGKKKIGYAVADIGTHSLRSGAAMALFLANESVYKIMILGRWSSDAFLAYIRPQVLKWTSKMSKLMTTIENFFHAPDAHSVPTRSNDKSHRDDPHIPGDSRAFRGPQFALSFFNGPNAASFLLPRLHLFH